MIRYLLLLKSILHYASKNKPTNLKFAIWIAVGQFFVKAFDRFAFFNPSIAVVRSFFFVENEFILLTAVEYLIQYSVLHGRELMWGINGELNAILFRSFFLEWRANEDEEYFNRRKP